MDGARVHGSARSKVDIFIDESGAFIVSPEAKPKVSCVTALVLPSCSRENLYQEFIALRASWGYDSEVKGSALDEVQVTQVIGLLRAHDAVVEICAIDSGHHGPSGVARFKVAQARKIREAVTPNHHPNLARQVYKIAEDWESLPDQLALQFVAAVVVVDTVIRNATNYYAQRLPMELGAFNWCIDAKDRAPTDYEETWRLLLVPFLQAISVSHPFPSIRGFDYSHFERFDSTLTEMRRLLEGCCSSRE